MSEFVCVTDSMLCSIEGAMVCDLIFCIYHFPWKALPCIGLRTAHSVFTFLFSSIKIESFVYSVATYLLLYLHFYVCECITVVDCLAWCNWTADSWCLNSLLNVEGRWQTCLCYECQGIQCSGGFGWNTIAIYVG